MKRKQSKVSRTAARTRQSRTVSGESFRRNVVVFSKEQKELTRQQQSVTQRQIERKRSEVKKRIRRYVILVVACTATILLAIRMIPSRVELSTNASNKLSTSQKQQYEAAWLDLFKQNAPLGQYWLLDEVKLEESILRANPEVQDITLSSTVPFGTDLAISVRFRRAVFTWRDATGELRYVDKDGVLFSKELDASVNAKNLISIEDQSGTVLDPGNPVLTTDLVKFVGRLHDQIKTVYPRKTIAKVIIPISTREVQIQVGDMPYLIKFSSERELVEQIHELDVLVKHLAVQTIQPTAYIDVRIPGKAFYK